MKKKEIPVDGMSCAACAISIENTLKNTPGVKVANVNYANHSATLEWEEKEVSLEDLQNHVRSTGYDLLIADITQEELDEKQKEAYLKVKKKTLYAGILALPVFLIGMFWMHMPYGNYIMWALTTPILLVFGNQFFKNAWNQAKNLTANMDTLVAISTGIAYIYSSFNTFFPEYLSQKGIEPHVYFEAAAVILFFILLGKTLEAGAKAGTGEALRKLMGLQPNDLTLLENGNEIIKKTDEVKLGEKVLIKPGQKIPLDGKIIEGESYVNENMLTGEPIPVLKALDSKVFAGTINQSGSFVFEVEKISANTLLSQIISRVKEAQGSKAPVQKLVDKIASIFVPVVLLIGLITLLVWGFSGVEEPWLRGMLAMVTVFVIACPCALGLATPTAIITAMGRGAEMGFLIKDAESLEKGVKIDTIILDKTGTITEGKPKVSTFRQTQYYDSSDAKALYSLEKKSEHPLASAISAYLNEDLVMIQNFKSITGNGVTGDFEGQSYKIGNLKWLKNEGLEIDESLEAESNQALEEGAIVVFAAKNEQILGFFKIADQIKENSKQAISRLQEMGIEVHMVTGDQQKTASYIASQVGIDQVAASMLPQDKSQYIKTLQAKGKKVAMVGDGINDSEALSVADLSIAMGQGTDIAMDIAEITLVHSDLNHIPQALGLTKKTVKIIRQNLFWAFIYNVIGIPLAAGVLFPAFGFLLNPMIAGAAMALSSVSVVTNSLRLRK
ncbi:copper/silver-translocating P-type ATPase [Belliella baltica DSM 15883]|uniref:Copper/silver-translocating P-type ATPase n=1 Tax=Belliella baltica (strain DSM 15883 / CIP 108006 / LMG 21964 / BA134) TaxID=866536 RepID=I3Z3Y9_BELBD|nr:heavy metal translocating P-type ATPase [Belliella baltica]AFL83957.1 copper/silver-translocating P-type ATPase [Belliella baltica DSM 15883]